MHIEGMKMWITEANATLLQTIKNNRFLKSTKQPMYLQEIAVEMIFIELI